MSGMSRLFTKQINVFFLYFVDGWVDLPFFILFSLNRHIFVIIIFIVICLLYNYNCGLLCCQLIYSIVFAF